MPKRFTDTNKWNKNWFCNLNGINKLLWLYLLDNCDNAGFIELNLKNINNALDSNYTIEKIEKAIDKHLIKITASKYWIPKFIEFQYSKGLSEKCKAHISVINAFIKYNISWCFENLKFNYKINKILTLAKGLDNTYLSVQDKDKDKDILNNKLFNIPIISNNTNTNTNTNTNNNNLISNNKKIFLKESETKEIWESYKDAYLQRYKIEPKRNAMINGQLSNLVKRLGKNDAPKIAEFYLQHNNYFYVKNCHPVGVMLKDAEKLYTEFLTGNQITDTRARQIDRTQSNVDAVQGAAEIIKNYRTKGIEKCNY